jgi:hypothetical protein
MSTDETQQQQRLFRQQLDVEGNLHDLAAGVERLRLFEPAPAQLPGQTRLELDEPAEFEVRLF